MSKTKEIVNKILDGCESGFITTSGIINHYYSVDSGDYIVLKKQEL